MDPCSSHWHILNVRFCVDIRNERQAMHWGRNMGPRAGIVGIENWLHAYNG